jgi:hypothetical protein
MWPFQRKKKKRHTEPSAAEALSPVPNRGWVYWQKTAEGDFQVLSVLQPDDVQALGGLPDEAVVGSIGGNLGAGDEIPVGQFRPNRAFVTFMHQVIETFGPDDPELLQAAAQQGEGWLYIIDLRTPEGPQGRVPSEDIVGAFEVRSGQIIKDSYGTNDKHVVFSEHGLVQLPPSLQAALIRELKLLKIS